MGRTDRDIDAVAGVELGQIGRSGAVEVFVAALGGLVDDAVGEGAGCGRGEWGGGDGVSSTAHRWEHGEVGGEGKFGGGVHFEEVES